MAYLDTAIREEELGANTSVCVKVGELQVGLFRTGDGLFAINNVCPHKGAPLHDGFIKDGRVTCPWHQWDFQLSDGACLTVPQVRVGSYPVEVRDGTIWINPEDQGAK
jgi:NAD(P)H-dependent nitrite reductase small subunit